MFDSGLRRLVRLLLVPMLLVAGPVFALGVEPIRVLLSPDQPSQTLRVRNDGNAPRLVQLETFDWKGWDRDKQRMLLTPSDTLIANPPAFRLAPHSAQLVRIGLPEAPPGSDQSSYRLLIRELPTLDPQTPNTPGEISLLINLNLPVFYTPAGATQGPVVWRVERGSDGQRYLLGRNDGQAAIQIIEVRVADNVKLAPGGPHNGYLLAGQTLSWRLAETAGPRLTIKYKDDKGQWSNADVALP